MAKMHYVCLGTCHADIDAQRYKEGLTQCGAESCSQFREPFHACRMGDRPHKH